jgi:hypothetical protein
MDHNERKDQDGPILADYRHIVVHEINGVVVVRFSDLKSDESPDSLHEISQELEGLVDQNKPCSLILDIEGKDLDAHRAVFYGRLIRLWKKVKQARGTLKICNISALVVDVLKIDRLTQMFPPYRSLDDALAGKAPDFRQFSRE